MWVEITIAITASLAAPLSSIIKLIASHFKSTEEIKNIKITTKDGEIIELHNAKKLDRKDIEILQRALDTLMDNEGLEEVTNGQ